jgi:hypothetical protein
MRMTAMVMLMVPLSIGCSWERPYDSFTVHLMVNGSTFTVIPFEG